MVCLFGPGGRVAGANHLRMRVMTLEDPGTEYHAARGGIPAECVAMVWEIECGD